MIEATRCTCRRSRGSRGASCRRRGCIREFRARRSRTRGGFPARRSLRGMRRCALSLAASLVREIPAIVHAIAAFLFSHASSVLTREAKRLAGLRRARTRRNGIDSPLVRRRAVALVRKIAAIVELVANPRAIDAASVVATKIGVVTRRRRLDENDEKNEN